MTDGPTSRTDVLRASPPMFESRVLDSLSRVHPAVPVIIFLPAIIALSAWGLTDVSGGVFALLLVAGYALWTLFEYWLHRIVFHFEPADGLGRAPALDHPRRPPRPPQRPAAPGDAASCERAAGSRHLLACCTWCSSAPTTCPTLAAGFLVGYLVYDMTHYYLHHFRPRGGPRARCASATCAITSRTTRAASASARRTGTRCSCTSSR